MSKLTIIEGNSNDKDNVRVIMVKGEKGEKGDNGEITYSDIVDNLTSTSTNKVLSARQGKVLKDLVDTNSNNIAQNTTDIENEVIARTNADSNLQTNITNEATSRATADSNLQSQISSLASGSPLVASSTSGMTDTTKVYVNTTDGNWYYYNGSSWISGGTYQSTGLNDSSIDYFKLSQNASYGLDADYMPLKEGYSKAIITTYSRGAWGSTSQESDDNIKRVHSGLFQLTTEAGLVILKSSDYQYSLQTYDLEGSYLSETGWVAHSYRNLDQEHKYRINVKRNDNADMNSDSFNSALPIIIVEEPLKINNVGYITTKKLDEFFTLFNHYSTSPSTLTRSAGNNRFTTDKVYVLKGTTFRIKITTAQIGVLEIDENDNLLTNTGYLSSDYTVSQDCYVILNGKKTSNSAISDSELDFISRYIQVEQTLKLEDIKYNREKITNITNEMAKSSKQIYDSINVEYFRVNNSSCTLVRIPKTSNDGKKIRPHVCLTSTNNELSGTKTSTLTYSKTNNSLFVINGGVFNTSTLLPEGQTISKENVLVDEPMYTSNGHPRNVNEGYPLCIDEDGNLSSDYDKTVTCATLLENDIKDCVCGWGCLIKNHALNTEFFEEGTGYHTLDTKNPIQLIGQYQNGDYFVLTIDGDRGNLVNERGMTVSEAANVLLDRNVKYAYELDGGGSSETVLGNRQLNPIYELTEGRIVPTVISFEVEN